MTGENGAYRKREAGKERRREKTHKTHGFAHDEYECLVGHGLGRSEEEEAESDVEEGEGADDGACADERHDCYFAGDERKKCRVGTGRWEEDCRSGDEGLVTKLPVSLWSWEPRRCDLESMRQQSSLSLYGTGKLKSIRRRVYPSRL